MTPDPKCPKCGHAFTSGQIWCGDNGCQFSAEEGAEYVPLPRWMVKVDDSDQDAGE